MRLNLSHQVQKFLKKLDPKQARQIAEKIQALKGDPYPTDHKKIREYTPFLRTDIGEYRIVYKIADQTIFITLVDKRNDDQIYKLLQRKLK